MDEKKVKSFLFSYKWELFITLLNTVIAPPIIVVVYASLTQQTLNLPQKLVSTLYWFPIIFMIVSAIGLLLVHFNQISLPEKEQKCIENNLLSYERSIINFINNIKNTNVAFFALLGTGYITLTDYNSITSLKLLFYVAIPIIISFAIVSMVMIFKLYAMLNTTPQEQLHEWIQAITNNGEC